MVMHVPVSRMRCEGMTHKKYELGQHPLTSWNALLMQGSTLDQLAAASEYSFGHELYHVQPYPAHCSESIQAKA